MNVGILILLTLVVGYILKKRGIHLSKNVIMVVFALEILGTGISIYDDIAKDSFDGEIIRGTMSSQEEFIVETDEQRYPLKVSISARQMNEDEANECMQNAILEIDQTFFGENESPDAVQKDVVMNSSYQNGQVLATWRLDQYSVIDSEGHIHSENLTEDTLVNAYCTLKVGSYTTEYSFPFMVKLPDIRTQEGLLFYIQQAVTKQNQETLTKERWMLPSYVEEYALRWIPKTSHRGLQLALLGLVAGGMILLMKKEEEKQKKKKHEAELTRDYPDIVSNLSLYVGAGVSVKGAFSRMGGLYQRWKQQHPGKERAGYEEVMVLCREMEDGKGELEAYQQFGRRIGHKNYRKLSLILTQNLRKGSAQLTEQLEKEEKASFDERKVRAKIAGEEASTKLLLPMFGMLAVLIVILVFPALQGITQSGQ